MKTYNFKARFADAVEHDRKLNTIRAVGHRPPPVVGEVIRRYTGMRTKQCRFLGDRICRAVAPLRISRLGEVFVCGHRANSLDRVALAISDGFSSVREFIAFFASVHGLPFRGHFIAWHPISSGRKTTSRLTHDSIKTAGPTVSARRLVRS